jgi:NADPH:quinone reductase-like Zn-dependent oxidoreductase
MRAAAIDGFGPPEQLYVHELPRPEAFADRVLVRVVNAGVQLTDAAIRGGWTPPGATITFPQILGNEFSGIVAAVGPDVADFEVGDPVLGFNVLGCYAEYVSVPRSQLVRKPPSVEWEAAGALSASGQTAHTALEEMSVARGETVVVHGAAGGVGSMFTQLAVLRGATVIGTASPGNHDYLRSLGAVPVSHGDGQADRIRTAAEGPVDAVFDAAGHGSLRTAIDLVRDRARIATIVDMRLAAELGCRTVRSRRSAERLAELVGLVATGRLGVHIRRVHGLDGAAEAHRDVETGHGRGKVVLAIGAPR